MKIAATCLLAAASTVGAFAPTTFVGRSSTAANIAAGDKMPSATLFQGFPDPTTVDIAEYVADKNVIMIGLPGAFPGYLEAQDELKAAGVDEVVVYCVNDPAVMQAWGRELGTGGSMVSLFGDPAGELTEKLDLKMVHPGPPSVGIIGRCKRFAIHVVNGEVKYVAVSEGEDDPAGDDDPSASLAPAMLEVLKTAA